MVRAFPGPPYCKTTSFIVCSSEQKQYQAYLKLMALPLKSAVLLLLNGIVVLLDKSYDKKSLKRRCMLIFRAE